MSRSRIAVFLLALQLALPSSARADCPSSQVDDVLRDPRVQEALDQAWHDSMEGTDAEHEEGGWILQCRSENVITHEVRYYTLVLRWPPGDYDSSGPSYPPRQNETCRTVASFHTHPGPAHGAPGDDGHSNEIPSGEDYLSAASDGVPGIIRYGSGNTTSDFTYNYGTIGDEPREPGWDCPPDSPPGGGFADPHMQTLDGLAYDFMAIGDFVLTTAKAGDLEIQARLQPFGTAGSAAITTGIAVRNGADRVEWRFEGEQLIVNGAPLTLDRAATLKLRSHARLRYDGEALMFVSTVGDRLRVQFASGSVDYTLLAARSRRGTLRGLFGNFDGDQDNDLQSADGQIVTLHPDEPPDYQRPLYQRFGESWRVPASASLFSTPYATPPGPPSFDAKKFPRAVPPAAADARSAAEQACKAAGVSDPPVWEACVFDYVQSGGASFTASAARADRGIRESVPVASARDITIEEDVKGRLEDKTREVIFPVTLAAGTYLFDARGSYRTTWRLDAANGDDFLAGMNVMDEHPRRVTLAAGRYRLRVAIVPEASGGRFRFRVRKPAPPDASALQAGARVSGRIDAPGQMRTFQLHLEPGKYDFLPKSEGDLSWSLTGTDGYDRFDANQHVFMERAAGVEITARGTYTLSVSGRDWIGTGSYDVGFTRVQ